MPIPEEMNYVPDSIAERFIVEYAENGKLRLDDELAELLEMVKMELKVVENAKPGTKASYMNECAEIINEIYGEVFQ